MTFSPHAHELNSFGTACAGDCPACRWAAKAGSTVHAPGCNCGFCTLGNTKASDDCHPYTKALDHKE